MKVFKKFEKPDRRVCSWFQSGVQLVPEWLLRLNIGHGLDYKIKDDFLHSSESFDTLFQATLPLNEFRGGARAVSVLRFSF